MSKVNEFSLTQSKVHKRIIVAVVIVGSRYCHKIRREWSLQSMYKGDAFYTWRRGMPYMYCTIMLVHVYVMRHVYKHNIMCCLWLFRRRDLWAGSLWAAN